jgi:hypothetical protein
MRKRNILPPALRPVRNPNRPRIHGTLRLRFV